MRWNGWWEKLFFRDAPAQGAFYALTQLLLGSYLLFSLLIFLLGIGWLSISGSTDQESFRLQIGFSVGVVLFLLLFCYYAGLTFAFYFSRQTGLWRYAVCFGLILWVALLLWGYFRLSLPGIWATWLFAFFFTGVLPLFFCGRQWKPAFGSALAWCIGTLMLLPLLVYCVFYYPLSFSYNYDNSDGCLLSLVSIQFLVALSRFPGISGWGWSVWAAGGLLFLALWYWLTALFFVRLSGEKLRSLFGKGVIVWWSAGAAVFLLFTLLTWIAGGEVSRRTAELAKRFGRPMTAEALAECYFHGRKPDAAFWDRWEKSYDAVDPFKEEENYAFYYSEPNLMLTSAGRMKQWRNHFEEYSEALKAWEAQTVNPLPPRPRHYQTGKLIGICLPELNWIRQFNRLQLWRIYFALADGRIDEALATERRMKRSNQYLQQDSISISLRVWIVCEKFRLSGIEMMLESGKLPESVLHRLSAELAEQEKAISPRLEQVLYCEAVQALDFCKFIQAGWYLIESDIRDTPPVVPGKLRCFVPQLWWYFRREMAELLRICNIPELHHAGTKQRYRSPGILASMIAPNYTVTRNLFLRLTARLRAVRGLIQAELYRRKHGDWPESLPDLPLDPFSGKPLLYRKGECLQKFNRIDSEPPHRILPEIHSIPAIQVWSVGPDGVDNGGFRPDGSHCDDVRALLRIQP